MNIFSFVTAMIEGVYQFVVVALILVASIVQDWMRILNPGRYAFAFQLVIPLVFIAFFVYREVLFPKYTKALKEDIKTVVNVITKPPVVPRSARGPRIQKPKSTGEFYDTDEELSRSCSEDVSTIDLSNCSDTRSMIDWSTRERRIEIARYTPEEIKLKSINDPRILLGWKISMNNGNDIGVIVDIVRRKFAATKFSIEMNDGSIEHMKLMRSATKGTVPFVLLEKVM